MCWALCALAPSAEVTIKAPLIGRVDRTQINEKGLQGIGNVAKLALR